MHDSPTKVGRNRGSGLRRAFAVGGTTALALAAVGLAATQFTAGDTISGLVLRNGSGSRIDVRADGTHNGSGWDVVFRRNLNTGDAAHDVQFAAGGTYAYQVALFDNAGGIAHNTSEASNIYHMTLPAAPGPLVFDSVPASMTGMTGSLLSSGEITISASWNDATRDDVRKRWDFDGTDWTQSGENEDRLGIIWDMNGDDFATAGTCADSCHPPNMSTNTGTLVDTWHWKAARTNPTGYADDKYWDDGANGTASGRHGDAGQSTESSNVDGALPAFMGQDDPGASARFLFSFPEGTREAAAYTAGSWADGNVLPAYVARRGAGSRVDTHLTMTHDGSAWTAVIRRKLDTGDTAGDIKFAPGGMYSFQVATFDNAGGSSHDVSEAGNVFTMTVPNAPGPLVFSAVPGILAGLSGELLDSEELSITAVWPDATRNEARHQWRFSGGSWTQSGENEDRIGIIWDMQGDGFASAGTCAAMCHPPAMKTAAGTFVDTWHVKAARTAPGGYVDDKHWDDTGRHSDAGVSDYKDNSDNGGVPTFMSAAGPGTSARFLFDHPPAAGWQNAVPYAEPVPPGPDATDSAAKKAKLGLDFGNASKDSFSASGTFDKTAPPSLGAGATVTVNVAGYEQAINLSSKGKSEKNANLKLVLDPKKGKWSIKLKKVDLKDALGLGGEAGGIPRDIPWMITLADGWHITGTVTMSGKVNISFSPKSGGAKIRVRARSHKKR